MAEFEQSLEIRKAFLPTTSRDIAEVAFFPRVYVRSNEAATGPLQPGTGPPVCKKL